MTKELSFSDSTSVKKVCKNWNDKNHWQISNIKTTDTIVYNIEFVAMRRPEGVAARPWRIYRLTPAGLPPLGGRDEKGQKS